jgi:hypothetical protein
MFGRGRGTMLMNQGRGIAFTSKVETMKEEEIKNSKKENSFRGRG